MTSKPDAARPHSSVRAVALLLLALLLPAATRAASEATADNWIGILGIGGEGRGRADSGVVGMTAEERDRYVETEQVDLAADEEVPQIFVRARRRFVMREMKINSDWDADPTAVPAMVDQFKVRTGMDAQALLPRKPLTFDSPEMLDWPFVFLTAHYAFTLTEAEEEGLKKYIARGGFLYADDCLYGQTFGPAFQAQVNKLFPEPGLKALDRADPAQDLIYKQKYSFQHVHESGIPASFMNANPFLGLFRDGRVAILYSPQDISCLWEISSPPTPSNPLGAGMHSSDLNPQGREAAYRLGVNIMLYSLAH